MTRLALLALALAACEPAPTDAARPAPPADVPFLGTEWRPVAVGGAELDSLPGSDALISIAFTERPLGDLAPDAWSLGGYNGCNDFGMAYRLDGDPASPEGAGFRAGAVFSDAMACGAPGEHVSDYVWGGLGAARRVRLAEGRLTFVDSLGADQVVFEPRPIRAVDSVAVVTGRWRLDPEASTVTESDGQPLLPYTVAFGPDSTYAGELGCARFGGTYALRGDRFRLTAYDAFETETCGSGQTAWGGELGLSNGEIETRADRLVLHHRTDGRRLVFTRP